MKYAEKNCFFKLKKIYVRSLTVIIFLKMAWNEQARLLVAKIGARDMYMPTPVVLNY